MSSGRTQGAGRLMWLQWSMARRWVMRRAHAVDAFVVWALSIVLAAVFVIAGVPKLLGIETVGLQAAAMRGFPPFIRVIVGVIETLGGIALLVPPAATTAAVVLAAAMVPATATQAMSGEPGTFVPITLAALLVFVAWRRNAVAVRSEERRGGKEGRSRWAPGRRVLSRRWTVVVL